MECGARREVSFGLRCGLEVACWVPKWVLREFDRGEKKIILCIDENVNYCEVFTVTDIGQILTAFSTLFFINLFLWQPQSAKNSFFELQLELQCIWTSSKFKIRCCWLNHTCSGNFHLCDVLVVTQKSYTYILSACVPVFIKKCSHTQLNSSSKVSHTNFSPLPVRFKVLSC